MALDLTPIKARLEAPTLAHAGTPWRQRMDDLIEHAPSDVAALVAEVEALRPVIAAVERLLEKPIYHDCRGPSCLLCTGLETAMRDYRRA